MRDSVALVRISNSPNRFAPQSGSGRRLMMMSVVWTTDAEIIDVLLQARPSV
jgi:hypothetical protein